MKKIAFTFAIIFMLQSKAFPEFEINLTIPIGVSYILPYAEGPAMSQLRPYEIDYAGIEPIPALSFDVLMQIGNSFDLKYEVGLTSISLLANIGYSLESSGATFKDMNASFVTDRVYAKLILLNTINLGIIPKLNFYFPSLKIPFSVGLGGGVKIPFSGTRYLNKVSGQDIEEDLEHQDMRLTFINPIVPYVKLTYDTYFYMNDSVAFTFGTYIAYDFDMQYDTHKINSDGSIPPTTNAFHTRFELTEYGYSSFDIGLTFGVYFGRGKPKLKKEVL